MPTEAERFTWFDFTPVARTPRERAVDRVTMLRLDFDGALDLGSSKSGNYGHAGRKGQVGGSAPSSGGGVAAQVDSLKEKYPEVAENLAKHSGTEMGSIEAHTKDVGREWDKQLTSDELADISSRFGTDVAKLMEMAIPLHDIGKANAIEAGDKARQHEHTIPILQDVLRKEGFSHKDVALATELMNHDLIGPLFRGYEGMGGKNSSQKVADILVEKAKKVGMPVSDFVKLQLAFYQADASSYPYITQFMEQEPSGKWTFKGAKPLAPIEALQSLSAFIAALNLGGAGSGNFGHAGREGEVGGSAPGTGPKTFNVKFNDPDDALFATKVIGTEGIVALVKDSFADVPGDPLHVTVSTGELYEYGKVVGNTVRVRVHDGGSPPSSEVKRTYVRDKDGNLTIKHDLIIVEEGLQGAGVAKRIMAKGLDEAERLGASEIKLDANIDVGGYAWARMGFAAASPGSMVYDAEQNANVSMLFPNKEGIKVTQQEREHIINTIRSLDRDPQAPQKIAGMWLGKRHIGKEIMLGASWRATLDMKDPAAVARMRDYIGGKAPAKIAASSRIMLGGAGSGNFGHKGREGEVGGSAPGDASAPSAAAPSAAGRTVAEIERDMDALIARIGTGMSDAEYLTTMRWLQQERDAVQDDAAQASAQASAPSKATTTKDGKNVVLVGHEDAEAHLIKAREVLGHDPLEVAKNAFGDLPGDELSVVVETDEGGDTDDFDDRVTIGVVGNGASLTRTFQRDEDGNLTVHHDLIRVPEQGAGAAKAIIAASLDEYARIGVTKIEMNANIKVGAYAWARYGFAAESPGDLTSEVVERITDLEFQSAEDESGVSHERLSDAQIDRVREVIESFADDPQAPAKISSLWVGKRHVGKELLIGMDWDAKLDLTDPEAVDRVRDYATGKLTPRPKQLSAALAYRLGGEGSGNFGHAGREGEVGGSAPGSGKAKADKTYVFRMHDEDKDAATKLLGADVEEVIKTAFGDLPGDVHRVEVTVAGLAVHVKVRGEGESEAIRTFYREGNGDLTVHHDRLIVDESKQGAGVAKRIMAASLDQYEKLGVTKITTHANIDVGGYAWARFAFTANNPSQMTEDAIENVDKLSRLTLAQRDYVKETIGSMYDDPQAPAKIAGLYVGKRHVGKEILLETPWDGSLDLKDEAAVGRVRSYIRGGRKPRKRDVGRWADDEE